MSNAAYNNNGFISDDGKSHGKESHAIQTTLELSAKSSNGIQTTDDYDPYAHRKVHRPLSNLDAFVHLLKCALGTGIFAMPNAFNHSGYVVGIIGTIILGSIATYCVHMLVNLHYVLCKWKNVPSMSYPLVAEAALLAGPKSLQKFAKYMPHVINLFLCTYQIGACCIYVVFVSTNIQALLRGLFAIELDVRLIMVIILMPLILANWIRNLKYLAPLSTIGNCISIASFSVISYYIFREPVTLDGKQPYKSLSEFPMFFGTVVFALEAIGVVMPLENEMKRPKEFGGTTGILNRAMALVIAMYISLGFAGYIKYGTNIQPTITVNLPENELLAHIAKGLIAFGIFSSHPIQCYVSIDIIWTQYISKMVKNSRRQLFWEYVMRTVIVFITFILGVLIPNLDLIINLVGALTLSTSGILFPAFLECVGKWKTTSGHTKTIMVTKNVIIGLIGLAGFVIGTTLSMKDIIKTYLD